MAEVRFWCVVFGRWRGGGRGGEKVGVEQDIMGVMVLFGGSPEVWCGICVDENLAPVDMQARRVLWR